MALGGWVMSLDGTGSKASAGGEVRREEGTGWWQGRPPQGPGWWVVFEISGLTHRQSWGLGGKKGWGL